MNEKKTPEGSNVLGWRTVEKHRLNSDEDIRKIFNYPYLTNNDTVSQIKNHGRVMFIIRGPPYTKKTKLSNMLQEKYPGTFYCSMVRMLDKFDVKEDLSRLDPEILEKLIKESEKLVMEACCSRQPIIIVQNTHIRKKEMIEYVKLAIQYDYIVIMACTMDKFDITPEDLAGHNRLDINYLRGRVEQWENVPPLFTAWFISPNDSEHMRSITFEKLKALIKIKPFRSWFETDDMTRYFRPRANLCCLDVYSSDAHAMGEYYLSKDVQKMYGACFPIFILGYLITRSDIIGVAQLNKNVKSHEKDKAVRSNGNVVRETSDILLHYGRTTQFEQERKLLQKSSEFRKKWAKSEKVPVEICRPIHIAQKGCNIFNVEEISEQFKKGLQLMSDRDGVYLHERYFEPTLYKLNDDLWFVNAIEKFCYSTIFTGFYV